MKAKTRIAGGVVLLAALAVLWTDPVLAATYTVTNLNNSGEGSLRYAVTNAVDGDVIVFDSGLSGTITLSSNLPSLASASFQGGQGIVVTTTNVSGIRVGSGETLSGSVSATGTASPSPPATRGNSRNTAAATASWPRPSTCSDVNHRDTAGSQRFPPCFRGNLRWTFF